MSVRKIKAQGSKQIAQAIIEMAEENYYLVDYNLPILEFSNEGKRVELPEYLEALVEANIVENDNTTINDTTVTGIYDIIQKKTPRPGKEIRLYYKGGNLDYIVVSKAVEAPDLPPSILRKILSVLRKYAPKSAACRNLCLSLLVKISKLEKNQ